MSPHKSAIEKENWKQFKLLLEKSPPEENEIKSIVKLGLEQPVLNIGHSPQIMARYGGRSQNVLHYIACYGNIDQVNALAFTPHWEKLKIVQDGRGRTALEMVSELLNKAKALQGDEYVAEKFGNFAEEIGGFTPWSESNDADLDFAKYVEELEKIQQKLTVPDRG